MRQDILHPAIEVEDKSSRRKKWAARAISQWNTNGSSRHSQEAWLLGHLAEPAQGRMGVEAVCSTGNGASVLLKITHKKT